MITVFIFLLEGYRVSVSICVFHAEPGLQVKFADAAGSGYIRRINILLVHKAIAFQCIIFPGAVFILFPYGTVISAGEQAFQSGFIADIVC